MSPSADAPARRQVRNACVRLADRGFLAATGGNVSLRAGDGVFAVTPSGLDYYSMSEEDVCVLRLDTLEVVEGRLPPSVESGLHAAVLRSRPDVAAVVHTHQPLVSAVALLHQRVPVLDATARRVLGGSIEPVAYAPSGTALLVRALRRRLRSDVNAYTLRNHGLVCCGATMAEALEAAELAERTAARFLSEAIARNGGDREIVSFALAALS
jgi:L-fuculose-phosphate aldolase